MTTYCGPGGCEIGFTTVLPFGKYKGKSFSSLTKEERLHYTRWMTHQKTALVFKVNLSSDICEEVMNETASDHRMWIDGLIEQFVMDDYYIAKANRIKEAITPEAFGEMAKELTEKRNRLLFGDKEKEVKLPPSEELIQALKEKQEQETHQLIKSIQFTLEELK